MKEIIITEGEESVLKLYEVNENDKWSIEMSPDGLAKLNGDFTIIPTDVWQMKLDAYEGLVTALEEIAEGKGRYDMDKLKHASNTIEDMIKIATDALHSIASEALNKEENGI